MSEQNNMMSLEALKNTIVHAFDGIQRSHEAHLFEGINIDDPELENVFRGLHWRALSLDIVLAHPMSLLYFTAPAFRFYLPGYMLIIATNPKETEELGNTLLYFLTMRIDKDVKQLQEIEKEYFDENPAANSCTPYWNTPDSKQGTDSHNERVLGRLNGFRKEQFEAIVEFCRFLQTFYPFWEEELEHAIRTSKWFASKQM